MTYLLFRPCIANFNIFYLGNRRRNKPTNFGMFGIFQVCVSSKLLHFSVGRKQPFAWILCNIPEVRILKFQTVVFFSISHNLSFAGFVNFCLRNCFLRKNRKIPTIAHYCLNLLENHFSLKYFVE